MKIYFSGIGGIGMSSLAQIAHQQNNIVIGSDLKKTYITEKLEKIGIKINYNQVKENITEDIDLFVYSSAIEKDNPEYQMASQLKINSLHRSEYLNQLLKNKKVIAITGSSGKTTTTTLTGIALNKIGIQSNLITGGWITNIDSNTIWNDSEIVVLEADESDGSLLNYQTTIGLITDLAVDVNINTSKFKNTPLQDLSNKLKEIYLEFIDKIKQNNGSLIISNDLELQKFVEDKDLPISAIFGNDSKHQSDYPYFFYEDLIQYEHNGYPFLKFRVRFSYKDKVEDLGMVELRTIGKYNAFNYLAAASIVFVLTQDLKYIKQMNQISSSFPFAKRRFEILLNEIINGKRLIVIDDYAHNPKKITSLMKNLNTVYSNYQRIAVFQPHRYTRTLMFWDKLGKSFFDLDQLIILPIYEAGEKPIPQVDSLNLTKLIKNQSNNINKIQYLESFQETISFLINQISNRDSLVVFIGAGNITNLAESFAKKLSISYIS